MRVKCLSQEHSTVIPTRGSTQTAENPEKLSLSFFAGDASAKDIDTAMKLGAGKGLVFNDILHCKQQTSHDW